MTPKSQPKNSLRIGPVVPHIFMHRAVLPQVIFSPGRLALDLAAGLQNLGASVTLFTPGPIDAPVRNVTADLNYFERELQGRGDNYLDLLKKHPFTFITLARQVQSELLADAFARANAGEFDVLHIYTNEEDTALPFSRLCRVPVLFTHHDPFNFLVKYRSVFPKYRHLNWVSMSYAQRASMPPDTNWVANIYHGVDPRRFAPVTQPRGDYVAYLGRIIQPKGVHLAIAAAKKTGVLLKVAGQHYGGKKDGYWREHIEPALGHGVEYVGFIKTDAGKQEFLGNARALVVPSVFEEPFGMVTVEALACGTPVIGIDSGATAELIRNGANGFLVAKAGEPAMVAGLAEAVQKVSAVDRSVCRVSFEEQFSLERMCAEHLQLYARFANQGSSTKSPSQS